MTQESKRDEAVYVCRGWGPGLAERGRKDTQGILRLSRDFGVRQKNRGDSIMRRATAFVFLPIPAQPLTFLSIPHRFQWPKS
jgi:hypothetical protein